MGGAVHGLRGRKFRLSPGLAPRRQSRPWATHLTSLTSASFVCKMGTIRSTFCRGQVCGFGQDGGGYFRHGGRAEPGRRPELEQARMQTLSSRAGSRTVNRPRYLWWHEWRATPPARFPSPFLPPVAKRTNVTQRRHISKHQVRPAAHPLTCLCHLEGWGRGSNS